MTAPSESKNLELAVTNLGPIAEAKIKLRPMTVFVGPSNTGKSYLAILMYALHRFFSGKISARRYHPYQHSRSIFGPEHDPRDDDMDISTEDVEAVIGWAERVRGAQTMNARERNPAALPESVAKLVRRRLEDVRRLDNQLDFEIRRCFGVKETHTLIRNGVKDGIHIVAERRGGSDVGIVEYRYATKGDSASLGASVPSSVPMYPGSPETAEVVRYFAEFRKHIEYLVATNDDIPSIRQGPVLAREVLGMLTDMCGAELLSPLVSVPHYLPASRTGIMHAHRVIVRSLVRSAARTGFSPEPQLPTVSGVLADFMDILIGLGDRTSESSSDIEDVAKALETHVLRGTIHARNSVTGYPEFSYRPDEWKDERTSDLRLMHTSSMVSELAPVVLYLRHAVRVGDVLFIEEPESHLHPGMQVEFVKLLARAAHAGVRIVITTHSEWVVDELANLVRLSDLPEDRRTGIDDAYIALDPEELGLWLFKPDESAGGTRVAELVFDEDCGDFRSGKDRGDFTSGFNDVAIDTYNKYARISNRIEGLRSGQSG